MRLNFGAISNSDILLYFREGADKTIIANLTAIKVDRFDHSNVFPEDNIILDNAFVKVRLVDWHCLLKVDWFIGCSRFRGNDGLISSIRKGLD